MSVVAIDARKYFDYGIGTYLHNLVVSLARTATTHKFLLLLSPEDRESVSVPSEWQRIVAPEKKYSLSELMFLGRRAQNQNADLLHVPHYTLPFGMKIPSVVTIHDLIHIRFPQYFSSMQRLYAHFVIRHALRASKKVIAVSHCTKADLLRLDDGAEDKIHVIHNGISELFRPAPDSREVAAFRKQHQLGAHYVLYVGGNAPHKNIATLVRAFGTVAEKRKDLLLVFAGKPPGENPAVQSMIERASWKDRIRWLGKLSTDELVNVYRGAEMLVLPSFYEGFGFPPLEAMACGTPCIVSDRGALPEIVGDAALICPADDYGRFGEAIMTLLERPAERAEYVQRGFENVRRFSWEVAAKKTLEVYESCL